MSFNEEISRSAKGPGLAYVFGISVLMLYLEMLVIRLVSTEIRIFAYLQNTILIVCLLSIGTGCACAGRSPNPKIRRGVSALVVLTGLMFLPYVNGVGELLSYCLGVLADFEVWQLGHTGSAPPSVLLLIGITGTFLVMVLIWFAMYPTGWLLGDVFNRAPARLLVYSANLAGSLVGIWLFTLLSLGQLSPWVWFSVLVLLAALCIPELARDPRMWGAALLLVALPLREIYFEPDTVEQSWSPYQKLVLQRAPDGIRELPIRVNNALYQSILDARPEYVATRDDIEHREWIGLSQYDIPAKIRPDAKKVLVVGAGSGNDVAGILRNLPEAEVTAVDIDPVIVDMGRRYHFERPYESSRVKVLVNDARAFFQRTDERFDLIVFGLLDSHTTPGFTNIRLDNFVYTRDALDRVREVLAPGGTVLLSFFVEVPFIRDRLATTLHDVFGVRPLIVSIPSDGHFLGGTLFIVGGREKVETALREQPALAARFGALGASDEAVPRVEPTTDDWPYLYIERRSIPQLFYVVAFMLLLLWAWQRGVVGRVSDLPLGEKVHFGALGAAFSLLQLYGLNKLALLFGSTWIVNVAVSTGIITMILVANMLSAKLPRVSLTVIGGGLLAGCGVNLLLRITALSTLPLPAQLVGSGLLVGLPVMFSGLLFARSFLATAQPHQALGANLFGAVIGGMLQLLSFLVGITSLLYAVMLAYLVALLTAKRS